MQFNFQAKDDLDNVGNRILGDSQFQVYQGNLPPLTTPTGLQAKALPGGRVYLHWNPVTGAADYQLFRQAPGQTELTAYQRTQGAVELTDTVPTDGLYRYAVASVRKVNSEEALSPPSDSVEVVADATAPAAPTQLQLELTPAGVRATWQAPTGTDTLTYNLYRAGTAIATVSGLTPLQTGLKTTTTLDSVPSQTEHYYAVTAVDAAGNESPPSASAYLNFTLLPVANLQVVQADDVYPVLSWSAAAGATVAGYRVYLHSGSGKLLLNTNLLTQPSYTDTGYNADARLYGVTAVDNNGVESLERQVFLPTLSTTLPDGASLQRGIMNRLEYSVRNAFAQAVDNLRLKVKVGSHEHTSLPFNLAAGATQIVPLIIGGYPDLAAASELTTTLEVTAATGEQARLIRTRTIERRRQRPGGRDPAREFHPRRRRQGALCPA